MPRCVPVCLRTAVRNIVRIANPGGGIRAVPLELTPLVHNRAIRLHQVELAIVSLLAARKRNQRASRHHHRGPTIFRPYVPTHIAVDASPMRTNRLRFSASQKTTVSRQKASSHPQKHHRQRTHFSTIFLIQIDVNAGVNWSDQITSLFAAAFLQHATQNCSTWSNPWPSAAATTTHLISENHSYPLLRAIRAASVRFAAPSFETPQSPVGLYLHS